MSTPVVIVHNGNQLYFRKCIEHNNKNLVYVIGDDSAQEACLSFPNVKFVNLQTLHDENADRFNKCFVNYSDGPRDSYCFCFLRVFYIHQFLLKFNFEQIFHIDSDCVVLENVNDIHFPKKIAYSIQKVPNPHNMVGSIHNSLLDLKFCDEFINLCFDIYENKSKFNLIEKKINWHKQNFIRGGICEMTILYLLHSENILDVFDTNEVTYYNDEPSVFDHQINGNYGGSKTYKILGGIKKLTKENGAYYAETIDGIKTRLLSLHFQGRAKNLLQGGFLDH